MKSVLIFGLLLVSFSSAFVKVPWSYHEEIGIPTAERIRISEEKFLKGEVDRIAGGQAAAPNAHPYFASILVSLTSTVSFSICSGTLLSANRLVTAAVCWFDGRNQASQFDVILGSNLVLTGGTRITTDVVITHPSWLSSNNFHNNIAMTYLPDNVLFSASIQPIAIPTTSEAMNQFVNEWAVGVGFVRINDEQGTSTVVGSVNLQVITQAVCQNSFGTIVVNMATLCTSGSGGVGMCGSNSGSPLSLILNGRRVLIGVSSFVGAAGCSSGLPSGFERTTSQLRFINEHLSNDVITK